MAQVFEGGKVVGTILTMNGDQQVLPLPGTDSDKLKKSFADYKAFNARSHGGSSSAVDHNDSAIVCTTGIFSCNNIILGACDRKRDACLGDSLR